MEPAPVLSYRRSAGAGDAPDECYRCGYDLRTIHDDQPCPECGLLARRSRRPTDELHHTRPRWLRRISRGANLVLCALLVAAAWPFLLSALPLAFVFRAGRSSVWHLLPLAGLDAACLLLLTGIWVLSTREGYAPADGADRRLRFALRGAALVPVLAVLLLNAALHYQHRAMFGFGAGGQTLGRAATLLLTMGCAPLPLLLFAHLRGLAKRARSAHLAEHCTIVGIGASAALVYCGAISLVIEFAEQLGLGSNWTGRSDAALLLILVMGTAAILFALWSVYLFVRFAIAFRRASQQLRGGWKQDDRSTGAPPPREDRGIGVPAENQR